MQKTKILLIFACIIAVFVNSSEAQTSRANKSKPKKSIKLKQVDNQGCKLISVSKIGNEIVTAHYNCPANVRNLTLSRVEIIMTCLSNDSCSDESQSIEISTEAVDPENDVVTYNYEISSGKIIGTGAKVVWDLSGVKAGTYTIRAYVDDGCGDCGKSITKKVKVIEYPNCN